MSRLLTLFLVGALSFYFLIYGHKPVAEKIMMTVVPSDRPLPPQPPSSRLEAGHQVALMLQQSAERMNPHWETIQPKSKAECLQASGGALSPVFVRCHYGYQEFVTYDTTGKRRIHNERSIPSTVPK